MLPVVWARIVWSGDITRGRPGVMTIMSASGDSNTSTIIIIGSVSSAECVIYLDVTILSRL